MVRLGPTNPDDISKATIVLAKLTAHTAAFALEEDQHLNHPNYNPPSIIFEISRAIWEKQGRPVTFDIQWWVKP